MFKNKKVFKRAKIEIEIKKNVYKSVLEIDSSKEALHNLVFYFVYQNLKLSQKK